MIPQLILAIGAVLAGIYYISKQPDLGAITSGAIGEIMAPVTLAISQTFKILGYITPLLIAVVPLYVLWSRRQQGEDTGPIMLWGIAYGLVLYGIAYLTGLDTLLIQDMRSSMFVSSGVDVAVGLIGSWADYLLGILVTLALWGSGILLSIIGMALDALAGVGEAASQARKPVAKARKGILEKLLGRGG